MNRRFGFFVAFSLVAAGAGAQQRQVNVYNWNDYVDPQVLEEFSRETGIKVVYDTYDNNEIVETKLLTGKSGYDIVVPSGPFLQRLIGANVFEKLDKSKLPNLRHVWGEVAAKLQAYDPGNLYAVNYMWGTTGIGVNVDKVRERLGDIQLNSWDIALKPGLLEKLKDCGVYVLDAPEDVFPGVLRYLGGDPNSKKPDDIVRAAEHLMKLRAMVRKFHSSEYINALAAGDICVAVGYSGDVLQAKKRAAEANNGVKIDYLIPKEGALMWFDSMAIPADAPNKAEAYAFIDFMMRPEVAARNSNLTSYANGNGASRNQIRKDILDNPNIFPDAATFARLFTNTAYDDRVQKVVTRQWTRVKTGK